MHLAIIGFGEVGQCYATALAHAGHTLEVCDIHPTPAMRALAAQLNAPLHDTSGPWLHASDAVLVCVTGGNALNADTTALPFMRQHTLLADTTTASPQHKRDAAQHATTHAVAFCDVAIMGLIASTGPRTPLLCAGEGGQATHDLLTAVGAPIRVLNGAAAGDAISLKLLRSIITKGLEALAIESLTAAEQLGVREDLYEVLSDMDRTPIRDFLNTLVRTHLMHAERRLHEMEEARAQLQRSGLPAHALPGVEAVFAHTVDALQRTPPATNVTTDAAITWLLSTRTPNEAEANASSTTNAFGRTP